MATKSKSHIGLADLEAAITVALQMMAKPILDRPLLTTQIEYALSLVQEIRKKAYKEQYEQ